jgi:hypothetical protein
MTYEPFLLAKEHVKDMREIQTVVFIEEEEPSNEVYVAITRSQVV